MRLCLCATAALCLCITSAQAQKTRTRTLDYDANRQEWVERPTPTPGTAAGDLYRIRIDLRKARYRRVLSACNRFEKKYGETDPLYQDVLILRASALVAKKKYDKAHVVLQTYLDHYGSGAGTDEAIRLEFAIAQAYLSGVKRRFLGIPLLSAFDEAYKILDEISVEYPKSELAEPAIKTKADHLFQVGEHALASLEYTRMLREFPRGRYQQFAMRRAADSALAGFAGIDFDEAALVEAEEHYNEYRFRFPAAADRSEVELTLEGIAERRAEKALKIAAYYERTEHPSSAIFYYRTLLKDWPNTAAATQAQTRLDLLGVETVPASRPDATGGLGGGR